MQVTCGQSYTYDHVFGGDHGSDPGVLYDRCVAPLVQGLFRGYNATVFAYGQTGSGKTYTMGSAFQPNNPSRGVIPKVMEAIFSRIASTKDTVFTVRVGFVEIHKVSPHMHASQQGMNSFCHLQKATLRVSLNGKGVADQIQQY